MRCFRVLLALCLLVGTVGAGEIVTDDGKVIKDCEIVSVTDKAVVYQQVGQKQVNRPINKVLEINFRAARKIPTDKTYSLIELTDGSVLVASKWAIKKADLEVTLLSGQTLKTPVKVVRAILNNALEDRDRNDWRNRVIHSCGTEAVVLKRKAMRYDKELKKNVEILRDGKPVYLISTLAAALSQGDAKGETMEVAVVVPDDKGKEEVRVVH